MGVARTVKIQVLLSQEVGRVTEVGVARTVKIQVLLSQEVGRGY